MHEIHNNLLKRHEKEIYSNAIDKVTIDRLKVELNELEVKCKKLEKEKLDLLQKQTKLDYNTKVNDLIAKLKEYKIKYKKCLGELRCFDEKFFDEIEDIKYYLQESLKLNDYYEGILHISNGDGKQISEKFEKLSIFNNKSKRERESIETTLNSFSTIHSNVLDDDDDNESRSYESDNQSNYQD